MLLRCLFAPFWTAKYGISHFSKLISLVFQQAGALSTDQCGYEKRPPGQLLCAYPRSFTDAMDTTDTTDTSDTTDTNLIESLFFRRRVANAQTACSAPASGRDHAHSRITLPMWNHKGWSIYLFMFIIGPLRSGYRFARPTRAFRQQDPLG